MKTKARVIAFYLPQFYPTPENDEWWGLGFTEWTNVARAKKLFRGHYQPKIPRDLGFYDLRLPVVREQQATLAKDAGIEGFCYWHYWFGNGRRLLDRIFTEVVTSGKPNYPFCLCWANHHWLAKTWDPQKPSKMLMEQIYPGIDDYTAHFYAMLPAFKDSRYMKDSEGMLIFGIFDPTGIPELSIFVDTWNYLAKKNGLKGFAFFAYVSQSEKLPVVEKLPYKYILPDYFMDVIKSKDNILKFYTKKIISRILNRPIMANYKKYCKYIIKKTSKDARYLPCLLPNYDHTPRSGKRGLLLHNSTPQCWSELLKTICQKRMESKDNIIFIKSWNEWGEGNYLEPDLIYGTKYLEETKKVMQKY